MSKNYIRKNGRVILCDSNIARMNILEGMYYHRTIMWEDLVGLYDPIKEAIKEAIGPLTVLFSLPIAFPYMAYFRIREAKRAVKK